MTIIPTATKCTMIRNNVHFPLSDGTVLLETADGPVLLYYIADDGLGMAPLTRLSERGPAQHGDTDTGYILEPRVVSYILAIHAPPTDDSRHLEAARMILLKWFRPGRDALSFRYDRASGDVMQIDGHFTGGMTFGSADREPGSWFQRVSVEFKANDPTFYNPEQHEEFIVNTSNPENNGITVPWPVPFYVRSGVLSADLNIFYEGTTDAFPEIELYGELDAPVIENRHTGERINLAQAYIPAGERYIITLRSGSKTIVDLAGNNRSGELSTTERSSLSTFHLAAEDVFQTIRITARRAGGQPHVAAVRWYDRYIGI